MADQHAIILGSGQPSGRRWLGLTVLQRLMATLERSGVSCLTLTGAHGHKNSPMASPGGQRSGEHQPTVGLSDAMPLHRSDAVDDIGAIHQALREAPRGLLVTPDDVVIHPRLAERIFEVAGDRQSSLVIARHRRPLLYLRHEDHPHLPQCDSVSELATALLAAGVAQSWQDPDLPVSAIDTPVQRRKMQRSLLSLNWRPHDGIVARWLNKHLSTRLSARLANTSVTPNQITTAAFLIGLLGVFAAAQGSLWTFFLGALLMQFQSIVDGCDGELARLKYQSSDFGAWYDTAVDDILGVLWVGAVGIGAYRLTGHGVYQIVGLLAASLYFISTATVYLALLRGGAKSHAEFVWWFEEDSNPEAELPNPRRALSWGKYLIRRDFYILLYLVLAGVGLLSHSSAWFEAAAVISIIGALAWFVVMIIQVNKRGLRIVGRSRPPSNHAAAH